MKKQGRFFLLQTPHAYVEIGSTDKKITLSISNTYKEQTAKSIHSNDKARVFPRKATRHLTRTMVFASLSAPPSKSKRTHSVRPRRAAKMSGVRMYCCANEYTL
jgi:hypothetical protein